MRRWRCWWTWPGSTTCFLIGDEAYREFVYAGEPLQSFGEFTHAAENVILIDTVSKRFCLRRPHRLPHLPATGS